MSDLVIDAMGLHSTLRQHRVEDATGGKQYSGRFSDVALPLVCIGDSQRSQEKSGGDLDR